MKQSGNGLGACGAGDASKQAGRARSLLAVYVGLRNLDFIICLSVQEELWKNSKREMGWGFLKEGVGHIS